MRIVTAKHRIKPYPEAKIVAVGRDFYWHPVKKQPSHNGQKETVEVKFSGAVDCPLPDGCICNLYVQLGRSVALLKGETKLSFRR